MIDEVKLHDALRYSGILPSELCSAFDFCPADHRRRIERTLEELGMSRRDEDEREDELEEAKSEASYYEREFEDAKRERDDEADRAADAERDLREAKRDLGIANDTILSLEQKLAATGSAAQ